MTDILEIIDDLHELQKLYTMGDICFIDFQEKILKYEEAVSNFEEEFAHANSES